MLKKISILFYCVCITMSCSNKNLDQELKDKANVDNLYLGAVQAKVDNLEIEVALHLIDSIYCTKKDDRWYKFFYYYHHIWMNNRIGNYETAIKYSDSLYTEFKINKLETKVPREYLEMYNQRGAAYYNLNNFNKAYESYFYANQLATNDNTCSIIFITNNIGLVLYKQHQYKEAIESFKKEIDFIETCPHPEIYNNANQLIEAIDNIALCYTKLNQYDSASFYYRKALGNIERKKYNSAKDTFGSLKQYASYRGVILGNLAKVYASKNELDTATDLYKEAIDLNTHLGFEKGDAQLCQEQLARIFLQKKQFAELKYSLDNLKNGLDTLPNSEAKLGWLEMMSAYHQSKNNSLEEVKYYRDFISMRDSLNFAKKGSLETTITKELKDKEQQLQITVLQKDNQLSKVYLWIVAAVCFVAAIIAFLVYRNYRKTKQLNEQVTHQKLALEKANKDKDRILNVVAHDLRNPIGAIANFLDIAQVKYEHSEDEEQILKTSQQAAVHSLTLINDLLEINQMQDGQLTLYIVNIDVEQLIEQAIEQLKYKAIAKQQTILLRTPHQKYLIKADAEKLQRVITNLIDNAIKFSFLKKEIIVAVEQKDNYVVVKITDSGVGIPSHIIEQLFTASITVKRKGTNNEKSNGLGLSICQQIIEAHNGKILVESQEGKGSCFSVLLPFS